MGFENNIENPSKAQREGILKNKKWMGRLGAFFGFGGLLAGGIAESIPTDAEQKANEEWSKSHKTFPSIVQENQDAERNEQAKQEMQEKLSEQINQVDQQTK